MDNDNDLALPPGLSPEARDYFTRYKAVAAKFIAQFNQKPFSWATIEAQDKMAEEIKKIAASYPPGTVGTFSSGTPALETHQYKGFIIAIHVIQRLNGQYSTMSGIRRLTAR